MARSPMNPETRAEARRLFDAGMSRNQIARELNLDPATITRWAKREGVEFDRSQTAIAVRAHTIDIAASRTLLAQKMLTVAHDLLESTDAPYLVYNFGGSSNTYREHLLPSPPAEVIRNAVTTAGIAFDKASKVLEQTPEGLSGVESLIDRLEDEIGRHVSELTDDE